MSRSLDDLVDQMHQAVLTQAGHSSLDHRRQLADDVRRLTLGEAPRSGPPVDALARALAEQPAQADLEALAQRGLSEDAVFELVLVGACAAGHTRLVEAQRALKESKR
jgi:hypothetical protein